MAVNPTSLPFLEAIAFFRAKLNLPTAKWDDLLGAAHDRAFVVAGAMKADLLADLREAIDQAISSGTTLDAFRADFAQIVAQRGWTGWKGQGTIAGEAWRTRVIYDTNLFTSYSAGRYQQMKAVTETRPYWRYRHSPASVEPRPEHLAWDGLILRHDDPWWSTHSPPGGFNSLVPWEGVNGKVMLGLKARYSGPIVEITGDSGRRLCLTSYHPVLTDRGWMPAGQVREGCYLLRYRFELDRTAESPCSDHNHAPPRADELFETLKTHGFCTVPRAAFNLYGDMQFINGDIDVVGANRELLDGVQSEILQFRKQLNLVLSNKSTIDMSGLRRPLFSGLENCLRGTFGTVADSFHPLTESCFSFTKNQHGSAVEFNPRLFKMRRQFFSTDMELNGQFTNSYPRLIQFNKIIREFLSWFVRPFPISVTQPYHKLLTSISCFNSSQSKIAAQCCPPNAKLGTQLLQALALLVLPSGFGNEILRKNLNMTRAIRGRGPFPNRPFERDYFTAGPYRDARIYDMPSDCGGTNPQAHRDILKAHPGLIELDRVKNVSIREFYGHVYDFQTKNGLIISLGGFCVSNCKCYVETLAERDMKKGDLQVTDKAAIPFPHSGIDKGWDYQPGASTAPLVDIIKAKAPNWEPQWVKAMLQQWQQELPADLYNAIKELF